ncbi:MAG: hypothetical protein F6J96_34565, partial [Symploca sp. SIO1C2]|nr:hypothetical protein [Symploca sp. SIO1C2]
MASVNQNLWPKVLERLLTAVPDGEIMDAENRLYEIVTPSDFHSWVEDHGHLPGILVFPAKRGRVKFIHHATTLAKGNLIVGVGGLHGTSQVTSFKLQADEVNLVRGTGKHLLEKLPTLEQAWECNSSFQLLELTGASDTTVGDFQERPVVRLCDPSFLVDFKVDESPKASDFLWAIVCATKKFGKKAKEDEQAWKHSEETFQIFWIIAKDYHHSVTFSNPPDVLDEAMEIWHEAVMGTLALGRRQLRKELREEQDNEDEEPDDMDKKPAAKTNTDDSRADHTGTKKPRITEKEPPESAFMSNDLSRNAKELEEEEAAEKAAEKAKKQERKI